MSSVNLRFCLLLGVSLVLPKMTFGTSSVAVTNPTTRVNSCNSFHVSVAERDFDSQSNRGLAYWSLNVSISGCASLKSHIELSEES